MRKPICGLLSFHNGTSTGSTKAMASASKASKKVATPMMIRVRTCHHEIGIRSIRATTSSMEPSPGATLSLALIVPSPICYFPSPQGGRVRSNKLHRDAAELAELVGEPGDAKRRMAEHAGGDAGLLDLGVAIHDAADPAQIDVHRPDRPAADH